MADPLSLLRSHVIAGKSIEETNGFIILGQITFPKSAKTNFRIDGWEDKDRSDWEFYTLECLVYFLKKMFLSYSEYVKEAARDGVPAVRRSDRKALTEYLKGTDADIPQSVDKSARLELANIKRDVEDNQDARAAKPDAGQVCASD